MEVTADPSWTAIEPDPGTLTFSKPDGVKVISIHAVSTLVGAPQEGVPEDVAAFLQQERTDIIVTNVTPATQSGRPAQRFRITMRRGGVPERLVDRRGR